MHYFYSGYLVFQNKPVVVVGEKNIAAAAEYQSRESRHSEAGRDADRSVSIGSWESLVFSQGWLKGY